MWPKQLGCLGQITTWVVWVKLPHGLYVELELLFAFDFYNGFLAAKGLVAQLAPPGVLNSNLPTPIY